MQDKVGHHTRRKRFAGFVGEIRCTRPEDFAAAVARIEGERRAGFYLAGFISYEAGYLTQASLAPLLPQNRDVPLLWMGIFKSVDEDEGDQSPVPLEATLTDAVPRIDKSAYFEAVNKVRDYIIAGDVYQANFTFQTDLAFTGKPLDFFHALTSAQPVPYAAYIDTGKETILSLSPELFFEIDDDNIQSRPMKGTAKRGRTSAEDEAIAAALARDPKERAENLMILDLMRNDLSRVTKPGSVKVPEKFVVERYRTVHQMTSTVEAKLLPGTDFPAILDALFPCGSITGAPKIRSMEIIRELETSPRGVYTGAIGYLGPQGDAAFNVAIRTLTLKSDPEADDKWHGRIGVGGGIVYDSTPQGEYSECQIKLSFLTSAPAEQSKGPFELIETMRCEHGAIVLLEEHLARLESSARFFDRPFERGKTRALLDAKTANLAPGTWRLRLLLAADGKISLSETALIKDPGTPITFAISDVRVQSGDTFLYHKTTRRETFEAELVRAAADLNCDEVLFLNERGELTEGARSTFFLKKNGRFLTPPLACGLLPGTLRAALLKDPATGLIEEVLYPDDLETADEIWFGNSVRGLQKAKLAPGLLLLAGE